MLTSSRPSPNRFSRWLGCEFEYFQIVASGLQVSSHLGQQGRPLKAQRDGSVLMQIAGWVQLNIEPLYPAVPLAPRLPLGLLCPAQSPASGQRCRHQGVHLGLAGAMVHHGRADRQPAPDGRCRGCDRACLLQLDDDLPIELVSQLVRSEAVAEADDVQLHRRHQLELGRAQDAASPNSAPVRSCAG